MAGADGEAPGPAIHLTSPWSTVAQTRIETPAPFNKQVVAPFQPRMTHMSTPLMILCFVGPSWFGNGDSGEDRHVQNITYRHLTTVTVDEDATVVRDRISAYYEKKYPSRRKENDGVFRLFDDRDSQRPVMEMVHSYPYGPFFTFFETTEKSRSEITVTKLDVHSKNQGKACRIEIFVSTQEKAASFPYSTAMPITDVDIRSIARDIALEEKTKRSTVNERNCTKGREVVSRVSTDAGCCRGRRVRILKPHY